MRHVSIPLKSWFVFTLLHVLCMPAAFAAGAPVPAQVTSNLAITLLCIMLALLLIIGLLAFVLLGVAQVRLQKLKQVTKSKLVASVIFMFCIVGLPAIAQQSLANTSTTSSYDGLSSFSYGTMVFIIGLEVFLIIAMCLLIQTLLAKDKPAIVAEAIVYKEPAWKTWWIKLNNFKPIGSVSDTGHDYDGIRELDNRLPPWWLYGFYACIVFALVYLYRFEVVHTAPSSKQEYDFAMNEAAKEKEAYLQHAASKVDENSVVLLTDASALGEGKRLFGSSCSPCHGVEGQGVVGPNLTDDYWLHKGDIKDVFRIIKYGIPEKGMKSWKDDFSPVQIAQLASYIKSLHGSKPAGAKEPQGEIFKETAIKVSNIISNEKSVAIK